ncbi:amidohydrolase family protein [Halorarum halophilum]|uniref:Amidohydrolase family protein n=1 Tax=Halorarum halophilum TaxID=2743090 RepID=A0A7D5GCX0_9EURY|nr:amidohydrolase family protein [Halobaculum halophilum]QLG26208.1 amidohydrolase family protein [Halobaculum halophilum]
MLELEHGFRVVDVHARLDPDEEAVATRGREISPERLQREMHQAGVVRAAVSPGPRPAGEGYLRANNAVARLSVDRPFVAMARLNGPRDIGVGTAARLRNVAATTADHHAEPGDVEQYAYNHRFHGFVLDPTRDGLPTEAVLEQIAATDSPVLLYSTSHVPPAAVAENVLEYDFPVVLSSFGGFPLDRDRMAEALTMLDSYDDLYLDTSFVRYRDVLERGLLEHPDRVLFGSGAPDTHPDVGVMEVLTLDVPEDLMTRAFTKNPARLFPGLAPGADD